MEDTELFKAAELIRASLQDKEVREFRWREGYTIYSLLLSSYEINQVMPIDEFNQGF